MVHTARLAVLLLLTACPRSRPPEDLPSIVKVHIGGNVDWLGVPSRLLEVRLEAVGQAVDSAVVGSSGRYDLDAQVAPGSWWVRGQVLGEGAPWWPVEGPVLFVDADATVQCLDNCGPMVPQRIVYARTTRAREEVALAWDAVAGAHHYAVTLQRIALPEGTVRGATVKLEVPNPLVPLDPPPDDDHALDWSVEAFDAQGQRLAHGQGIELPRGADPALGSRQTTPDDGGQLGMLLTDVDTGVAITAVLPGRPAVSAGLRPADVITALDGDPVTCKADLDRLLERVRAGMTCTLSVQRQGSTVPVPLRKPTTP